MRYPAARGRADANQSEIVKALEKCGLNVIDLHMVGGGCPDLIVAYRGNPYTNLLVEVKVKKGKLSDVQTEFFEKWPGPKLVARDYVDVLRYFGLSK